MINRSYTAGFETACARFGLEKVAMGFMPSMMARGRQFLRGQAGGLAELGTGLRGMLGPTANPGARGQAWQGLKTVAPSLAGIAGAGVLGHMALSGDDHRPQMPQPY